VTSITGRSWFEDLPVLAGGLLISLLGGLVGVHPSWIFHVLVAEEIPLFLPHLHLAYFITIVTAISTECQHPVQNTQYSTLLSVIGTTTQNKETLGTLLYSCIGCSMVTLGIEKHSGEYCTECAHHHLEHKNTRNLIGTVELMIAGWCRLGILAEGSMVMVAFLSPPLFLWNTLQMNHSS
jgi:hypothetical protein